VLAGDETADALIERLTVAPATNEHAPPPWRQLGLGAQILADLGVKRLRVLGTPRRLVGLAGFGLEVEGHEEPSA
jgi:3,4-dihydroxy 2-butanone 4-phosphate synthase/GTP cyclohydrolase II